MGEARRRRHQQLSADATKGECRHRPARQAPQPKDTTEQRTAEERERRYR
jgi:hypothetical protein